MAGAGGVRIDYVYPFFHPVVGGVETWLHEMGTRLLKRGHEVWVHCIDRTLDGRRLPARDERDGIRVLRYRPWFHRGTFLVFYAPRIPPGSVVDLEGFPLLVADWVRIAQRRKAVLVSTPRGAPYHATAPGARLAVGAYGAILGLPTLRRCRRVVVMTQNEARWLAARGVEPRRIVEVPSGIPPQAYRLHDPAPARERWGLGPYLLFLGRLYHEKGPVHLVEAFARVAGDFPELKVVFAGPDQGEAARVTARAQALGLAPRVVLTGPVSEEAKWALLAGCEMLVLPSSWEAQGMVLVEAWAQGRPVVATRVGGVPYIVDHGRTGLLVAWADPEALASAIRELLSDPGRAKAMGQAGRAEADKYDWDALAERLEATYEAARRDPL